MITVIFALVIAIIVAVGYATGGTVIGLAASSASSNPPPPPTPQGPGTPYSDQSLTGSFITEDPNSWPGPSSSYPNGNVWNICTAVGLAEGFNQGAGAAPYQLNNPGDLSPGDESGQATGGAPQYHGGSTIINFATCEGGFIALYTKFNNIVTGRSSVYPVSWTWAQVAGKYAGNSAVWLANVTNYLGVDPSTTPAQYVNG